MSSASLFREPQPAQRIRPLAASPGHNRRHLWRSVQNGTVYGSLPGVGPSLSALRLHTSCPRTQTARKDYHEHVSSLNNLADEWLNGGTTFKCTAATIESPLSISPARMASAARTGAAMINLHAVLLHLRITLTPTKPGSAGCVLKSPQFTKISVASVRKLASCVCPSAC